MQGITALQITLMSLKMILEKENLLPFQRLKCHNLVEAALTPHTTREADVQSHNIMATEHYGLVPV